MTFDFDKALQAVGVLLGEAPNRRMNYMRLLKLLYIADRESLGDRAATITGDQPYAMERGPVLSGVYDLIQGKSAKAAAWAEHVRRDHYDVEMVKDPGRKRLSISDVSKLVEVYARYSDLDEWDMVVLTHGFDEWKANYPGKKSAAPITWEDMLKGQGKADFIESVGREMKTREFHHDLFGA